MTTEWLDQVKWDDNGLVPAIAQDYQSGEVLMMAWMNREALALTLSEQRAVYWSRSRGRASASRFIQAIISTSPLW